MLGPELVTPATGYVTVYAIEIGLLFATLAAVGPLVRFRVPQIAAHSSLLPQES